MGRKANRVSEANDGARSASAHAKTARARITPLFDQRKNVLAYLRLHLFKCLGAVDDAEPFRFPGGDLIVAFLDAEEELPLGSFKAIELERECSIAPPAALFADLHGNPEQEG